MAAETLTGHGRPNVFLPGQIGKIYKDLDSGLKYVYRGGRGFIKVDGDDQSEMYNWELVESGGSTGGGVFTVNFTQNEDGSYSADKTLDKIMEAYGNGMVVQGLLNGGIYHSLHVSPDIAQFFNLMIEQGVALVSAIYMNNGGVTVANQFVTLTSTDR